MNADAVQFERHTFSMPTRATTQTNAPKIQIFEISEHNGITLTFRSILWNNMFWGWWLYTHTLTRRHPTSHWIVFFPLYCYFQCVLLMKSGRMCTEWLTRGKRIDVIKKMLEARSPRTQTNTPTPSAPKCVCMNGECLYNSPPFCCHLSWDVYIPILDPCSWASHKT